MKTKDENDSNQRVAVIITDGKDVLVGKSPQNINKEIECCDLMKGHAQIGEDLEKAALREVQEECGLHLTRLEKISDELQYTKTTTLTFFVSYMPNLPDPKTLKCQSFFEQDGREYPEIAQYLLVPIDELTKYVYRGIGRLIANNGLVEVAKAKTNLVDEAKMDPAAQVDKHLAVLTLELLDKLTVRCAELVDKWDMESEGDPIEDTRKFMGDERFMKFLRKTAPLKEPKPRDLGAHFFDPPFDVEEFVNEARVKKDPSEQVDEYIKSLSED